MQSSDKPARESVGRYDETLRRLAREFSELEQLRLDIGRAQRMLKSRSKLMRRTSKNR